MPRALCILAIAAASLLLVRAAPGYDPWTWLLWGREVAGGGLSTVDGPAFKPLPVAVCALLAPLGGAAPWLWVALVRAAAAAACWLAFRLGRRLAGGSAAAGALAAAGVALCGGFAMQAATGGEVPLVLALALAGGEAWRAGRTRTALLCGAGCALLRVEAWPFLLAAGLVAWRRDPRARALLAALAVLVPAAWFVPEWLGSGDPLRSGARARVPMPGQPALADVPALASLEAAARLALWPLWAGVALLAAARNRPALLIAAAGGTWVAIVATMAQAGFSGEPRYLLPGVALLSIAGAAGWAGALRGAGAARRDGALRGAGAARRDVASRGAGMASPTERARSAGRPRWVLFDASNASNTAHPPSRTPSMPVVTLILAVLLIVTATPRITDAAALRTAQAHQWALATDLDNAVQAAGGRATVLRCGTPYVGPLRGPLMAYHLHVAKTAVEPDATPRAPGVVFRARLTRTSERAPHAGPPFREITRVGTWEVMAACSTN